MSETRIQQVEDARQAVWTAMAASFEQPHSLNLYGAAMDALDALCCLLSEPEVAAAYRERCAGKDGGHE